MRDTKQHTPGPWKLFGAFEIVASGRKKHMIAFCGDTSGWQSDCNEEEAFANAQLIAAAPDLLKICEIMRLWMDCIDEENILKVIDLADDAIDKAKGLKK